MYIDVRNLSKSFEYYIKQEGVLGSIKNLIHRETLIKDAVKDVSFQIEKGEIVAFIGSNGAGKSTTLKMLSGILVPSQGSIHINGYIPYERKNEYKKLFSIVMGQKSQLWEDLPAIETFKLNAKIYDVEETMFQKRLQSMAELLEVEKLLQVQVRRLSLGERMKMELIAAMIHDPQVIFLDEPTIGLDTVSQRKIRDFLKVYCKENDATVILTSHSMSDITDLCKRSLIMDSGELIYDGRTDEIQNLFGLKKRISLKLPEGFLVDAEADLTCIESKPGEALFETEAEESKKYMQYLLDKYPVLDINVSNPPLEDCIELLYRRGGK